MSRRLVVVASLTTALFSACYEGGTASEPEFRVVTAEDLTDLGAGELLEIDLGEGPVRFELAEGLIDFSRITIRHGAGRLTLLQDLLVRNGETWGIQTAGAEAGFGFTLTEEMLASQAKRTGMVWSQRQALSRLPQVDLVDPGTDGVPRFVTGDLGRLPLGEPKAAAREYLEALAPAFRIGQESDLEPVRARVDGEGVLHVRLQQYLHGLPVVGGDMTVHADAVSGQVQALSGRLVSPDELPTEPVVDGEAALAKVAATLAPAHTSRGVSELVYVVTADGVDARLAWQGEVSYEDEEGPQRDIVFADAVTGELVARHPQIHRAKSRKIYNANNGQSLPGSLMFSEGGSSTDQTAMAAYNNAGLTYDYYSARHSRDSYDAAGAVMKSTVHYGWNYVNAFWDGSQMAYGDGDGQTAGPFAKDPDVVVHEMTHAVTQYEANLVYQSESGALNEGMSDILSVSADAWKNGVTANTWKMGEQCWTPNTPGDALRYMNNPTQDGQSYDYYPERYQGGQDNGGVHLNSGIANLAFYLLSQGGTHPRGKTANQVPAIGISKADKIFYKALADYLTSNSNFQAARNATASAAAAIHGANSPEVTAVHTT